MPIAGRDWRSGSIRTGRDIPLPCGRGGAKRRMTSPPCVRYPMSRPIARLRCIGIAADPLPQGSVEETICRVERITMPHPNDPALRSFIPVDPASDFPIQNLPYGVFSATDGLAPRVGVAIGDYVLDLWELEQDCRLAGRAISACSRRRRSIPSWRWGRRSGRETRARISELLRHDHPELRDNQELRERALVPMAQAKLHLPIAVSGYTDFYSSKEHATNVGVMFRGKDNALQPNWLHMPIGYNGRASTVVVSRHQGAPAARAVETAERGGADLRPLQAARFRARNGRRGRPALGDGRDAHRGAGGGDDLRLCASERLERARHPAMGICAARAVPGQGVCDLDQPVGGDARGAGAVPGSRPGAGSGAAALSAAGAAEQLRSAARCGLARRADERGACASAAPISNTCTGRRCSNWCITPLAAAP